jgi:hypothetical protein
MNIFSRFISGLVKRILIFRTKRKIKLTPSFKLMHNSGGMECFEKTVSEEIPDIEAESSKTCVPIKCNSVFVIDFVRSVTFIQKLNKNFYFDHLSI